MYKKLINNINNQEILDQIQRISDGAFIPFVEGNRDYQEYLKWLAEGNTPLPADE
ncbi:MAG: hypothetical protein ACOVLB_01705 [Candidatus Nanopelagicus sp.]